MTNKKSNELKFRKGHVLLKIILILFILCLIFSTAVFSAYIFGSKGNVAEATINIATDIVGKQETIFCLFLGISEDIKSNLTDTIILAGYNPNSQKAFLISIPRDTYVGKNRKNANSYNKINSLYQNNPEQILNAVKDVTGIEVNEYIVVKTKILRELVDSIGGVSFNVPIKMDYDDITQNLHIHLKPGEQILDGKKAEELVRFRHNNNGTSYSMEYGDNDFGRMRTQREFLKQLANQVININNITKITDITSAIFNNIQTNIELKRVLSYIPYGINFNTEDLKMVQLPGESVQINNIWFFEEDKSEANQMIQELLEYIE